MNPLHTLRNAPWLARLALLWFALTLGVAVASPMVSGDQQVMLCSAGGMVKVVINDDGSSSAPASLDCPLCAVGGAPAPTLAAGLVPPRPLIDVMQCKPTAHIVVLTAAPLPARGPPLASLL